MTHNCAGVDDDFNIIIAVRARKVISMSVPHNVSSTGTTQRWQDRALYNSASCGKSN